MRFTLIFILSLLSYSSILGQNTRSELKDLNFENYSRQQIRTYLLMIEPKDSEIYELARRSRTNQKWSYVFYGLSAAYFVGSIYGFSTMDQVNDGILT